MKELVKDLCRKKGVSMNLAEAEMGLAKGYISKLEGHNPNHKTLQRMSDYFNVSVDYLMTGKDGNNAIIEMAQKDVELTNMSDRLKEYALKMAKMPKDKQEHIMQLIDMLEK